MFEYDAYGNFIFIHGKTAYERAKHVASNCSDFTLDKDEDEWVTSASSPSCYNCLFRRWTHQSFICMKKKS
jgi:hypothetical protein